MCDVQLRLYFPRHIFIVSGNSPFFFSSFLSYTCFPPFRRSFRVFLFYVQFLDHHVFRTTAKRLGDSDSLSQMLFANLAQSYKSPPAAEIFSAQLIRSKLYFNLGLFPIFLSLTILKLTSFLFPLTIFSKNMSFEEKTEFLQDYL